MMQWFLLYTTKSLPQASIIKGMLEENEVPVMLVNKQDSSYVNFGEIELYVPAHLQETAKRLLDNSLLN
jgi:hypothetical protein